MAVGSAVMVSLLAAHRLVQPGWHVLAAAFQAGLVGSLADWYAVHVLLHPAPWFMNFWPFARHSNLLIRNRRKLEENIVLMVERELLSADKIWNHLRGHLTQLVLPGQMAEKPVAPAWIARSLAAVRDKQLAMPAVELIEKLLDGLAAAQAVRRGAAGLLGSAQGDENLAAIVVWLQGQIDRPAVSLQAAQLCGKLLADIVGSDAHDEFIESILRDLCQWIGTSPTVRRGIREMVDGSITEYRHRKAVLQQILVAVVQQVAINRDQAVDSIVAEIVAFLNRLEQEPAHPLRVQWKGYLLEYAQALQRGDEAVVARFNVMLQQVSKSHLRGGVQELLAWISQQVQSQTDGDCVQQSLAWLKASLRAAVSDPHSAFWTYIEMSATALWNRAAHDPAELERLTSWAAAQAKQLIESQHHRLGAMVAASLDTYADEQLIRAIDDKFGDDLQFIRLNGAVLGFLIGLVLGAAGLLLPI